MTNSSITVHKSGGVTYDGPDATNLYRARSLASALKLYADHGLIPTRGVTITKMLQLATGYSGKVYKRGQALQAHTDVKAWADAMLAALPVKREA